MNNALKIRPAATFSQHQRREIVLALPKDKLEAKMFVVLAMIHHSPSTLKLKWQAQLVTITSYTFTIHFITSIFTTIGAYICSIVHIGVDLRRVEWRWWSNRGFRRDEISAVERYAENSLCARCGVRARSGQR